MEDLSRADLLRRACDSRPMHCLQFQFNFCMPVSQQVVAPNKYNLCTFSKFLVGLVIPLECLDLFGGEGDWEYCQPGCFSMHSHEGLQFSSSAFLLSISPRANVGASHVRPWI